ncbi:MAG: hypothetical protein ACTHU0_23625 [Kofleriaceae bacterium]
MQRALVATAILAAARAAHAAPDDLVTRPLVLDAGQLEARLVVEANLQNRRFAVPLSLSPDLWYGVSPRWTLGIIHSNQSVDRVAAGASVCVRESQGPIGCDRPYSNVGVDARWSWREGELAVAPRARLLLRDVDPWKPAVTIGALARWTRGRFAITSDPYLRLGLANRDRGNRAALFVPVWLAVQPTCRWLIALHTGWDGELATIRDGWHVPFALAMVVRPTSSIDVGLEAGFPSLLGPQNDQKQRAALFSVAWRH